MTQSVLDRTDETRIQYELDMAVRNAMLAWLRAWEDRCGLPRSVPTKYERGDAVKPADRGHHNR